MIVFALGVAGALALAALLGVSDAPNATAALLAARTGSYPAVAAWSLAWHVAGGLLAGVAVARTVAGIVHVGSEAIVPVMAAASLAAVGFTWATTRSGLPTSASVGLVGGLAGAGLAAGGARDVQWGGLAGVRPIGVLGVLIGILLAPLLAAAAAGIVDQLARRMAFRLPRSARRQLHGGLWVASAAVAVADGTNDGQKAMGVLALVVSGSGSLAGAGGVAPWERVSCALILGAFTVIGGRRVVARVAHGLARGGAVDDLAAQLASAGVILAAAAVGLPLSTSTVVTSGMVGAGVSGRRRHVRWAGVARIFVVWALTVPACAVIGAGAFEVLRRIP
ncbi:MAG: inorganic phosphate transporter [Actinomycetota bacterium]|nr:inorganic phosphate transporter [Actinomycetota bacterium]